MGVVATPLSGKIVPLFLFLVMWILSQGCTHDGECEEALTSPQSSSEHLDAKSREGGLTSALGASGRGEGQQRPRPRTSNSGRGQLQGGE